MASKRSGTKKPKEQKENEQKPMEGSLGYGLQEKELGELTSNCDGGNVFNKEYQGPLDEVGTNEKRLIAGPRLRYAAGNLELRGVIVEVTATDTSDTRLTVKWGLMRPEAKIEGGAWVRVLGTGGNELYRVAIAMWNCSPDNKESGTTVTHISGNKVFSTAKFAGIGAAGRYK